MSFHEKRTAGFSLVELMVALVLGVVIVGGCISIFTGVVRSSSMNQTVSNLQSNARFVLDTIGRDVRSAGFIGCSSERNVGLNVTASNPPTSDLSSTAITGYVVKEGVWTPQMPMAYTAPTAVGKPIPETHALSVQYGEYPGFTLDASMTSDSSSVVLKLENDNRLRDGQLMVLSDCSSADLFEISSVTKSTTQIVVDTGASLNKAYPVVTDFPDNTRAMPFVSTIYYIGDTQRVTESGDEIHSLYAHSFPYTAANPPLELVEGVDQLVLEFGVRQADGSTRYAIAGAPGYRVAGVEVVRVGLLVSSLDRFSEVDNTRAYTLAGQNVSAKIAVGDSDSAPDTPTAPTASAATLTYPGDNRLRMPFNATFNVRNRDI